MQRKSSDNEQKTVDEKIIRPRLLTVSSACEQDNIPSRATPKFFSTRSTSSSANVEIKRPSANVEIKRSNALSIVPVEHLHNLLEIRSARKHQKPVDNDDEQSSIITINVSGDQFQTYLSTLELYPNTLLGNKNRRKHYWNPKTQEYFFDRHRACFEAILYYYQSHGRLRRPTFVPIDTFLEEISFFDLGSEVLAEVRQEENVKEVEQGQLPRTPWRRYLWYYIEFPEHSKIARAINLISIIFTIFSCVSLAIETLPQYNNHWDNICQEQANISLNSTYVPLCPALFTSPFFIIQTVCVAYFTIEFVLRLISTPSYFKFVFSFFHWVDAGAIIPYYVFLIIELASRNNGINTIATLGVRVLRILRFSRLFKMYKVFKGLRSLQVLSATVKESMTDFAVMIVSLTLLAFIFGAATYLAEQETNGDSFDSIPKATYWAIITITGVGYGDIYPITTVGRVITCLCALSGASTMGILVSLLVDRYQRVYSRKMYLPEEETAPVDFDNISHLDDDRNSVFSLDKISRRKRLSAALIHPLATLQERMKNNEDRSSTVSASYDLQFLISFNNNNNDIDESAADRVLTAMKKKLTEAMSSTDVDIDLKLIDKNKKELWTMSSFDSSIVATSNRTTSTTISNSIPLSIQSF